MARYYHLDCGYITIPEATKVVLRKLHIGNSDARVHYLKILNGAKKGWFCGKRHGKRMYQVKRIEVIQYAEELLQAQKFNLFIFDETIKINEIEPSSTFSFAQLNQPIENLTKISPLENTVQMRLF